MATNNWAKKVLAEKGIPLDGPIVDMTDALQEALEALGTSNDDYEAERIALDLAGAVAQPLKD